MKCNISQFIIGLILLLPPLFTSGQLNQEIDYVLYDQPTPKTTTYSWDGWITPPNGSYGALDLFINIIYDQTPLNDPYPNPNGLWNPTTIEGINANLPTYLTAFLDVGLIPTLNGTMTRKYFESSFGELIITGDFVIVNIKQSTITPNDPGASFNSTTLIQKSITMINNAPGGFSSVYGNNNAGYYDRDSDGQIDLLQVITRNNTSTYGGPNLNWAGGSYNSIVFQSGGTLTTNNTIATRCHDDQIATNPTQLIIHEFGHLLMGSNEFHTSGGHSWGGVSGQTFLGNQGGYGIMGGSNTGLTSCNGYERWRLHWKDVNYNESVQ